MAKITGVNFHKVVHRKSNGTMKAAIRGATTEDIALNSNNRSDDNRNGATQEHYMPGCSNVTTLVIYIVIFFIFYIYIVLSY